MYVIFHLYPVQQEYQEDLLSINNKAAIIYKEYGALVDKTLKYNPKNRYLGSCMNIELKETEELYLGMSQYKNKEHYEKTILKVNQDSRIGELFNQFSNIVDVNRIIDAEFESE